MAHAVNQAEVDGFGVAALLAAHVFGGDAEHFGGGAAVHVFAVFKGFEQGFVAAQVRHDAQFDLRIVGRHDFAAFGRNKGAAHAAALFGADGDVLQVGVVAGEPAGDGHGLGISGVHAAGGGVDHFR